VDSISNEPLALGDAGRLVIREVELKLAHWCDLMNRERHPWSPAARVSRRYRGTRHAGGWRYVARLGNVEAEGEGVSEALAALGRALA
jgi:hypothetical protein